MTAWGEEGPARKYLLSAKSDRDLKIELWRRPLELTPAGASQYLVSVRRGTHFLNLTPATLTELVDNVDRTIDRIEEVDARGVRP